MTAVPPLSAIMSGGSSSSIDLLTLTSADGTVTFNIDEAPGELTFGVKPILVKKVKIGGGVTVQRLGWRPKDISFEGELFENTESQTALLEQLARAQADVTLTWRKKSYTVVLSDAAITAMWEFHATYRVEVIVKADLSIVATSSATSIDQTVASQMADVTSSYDQIALVDPSVTDGSASDIANASLTDPPTLSNAVSSAGPLAQASGNTDSLEATLTMAIAKAQTYLAALPPSLTQAIVPTTSMIASLTLILGNVQRGQAPKSVLVDGAATTLFRIASRQYPNTDPTIGARAIAAANNLSGLYLEQGVSTRLYLPPLPAGTS